jgi:hypothetical protein
MSTVSRIDTIHRMFQFFVVLTLIAFLGLVVTGNAWYWLPFFGGPVLAYRQVMKLPYDHPLRIYLRNRVDAWF